MSKELQAKVLEDTVEFSKIYEQALSSLAERTLYDIASKKSEGRCCSIELEDKLLQELKQKRSLGFQKYGESSFQSSLSNTLRTKALTHALEEVLDIFNYLFHFKYQLYLNGKGENKHDLEEANIMIERTFDLYISLLCNVSRYREKD